MNIREISKPVTAKALNESLAKRFGKKINLEAFTLEQLEDARNKLRTKLSQFETNESFDSVNTSDTYQKNKLFLDVLNAAVKEAQDENVEEKKKMPMGPGPDGKKGTDDDKPAFLDQSKGDSKDSKDKGDAPKGLSAKQKKLPKGLQKAIAGKNESTIKEGTVKKMMMADAEKMSLAAFVKKYGKENEDQWKAMNEGKEAKGKMPTKAQVMKMCKDGKKEAEILKMHPDCDKTKLKALIKSCKKEMKEAIEGYIKLIEGKEDEAELVMASKDMVTRVTSWMEDTAEMQTESMLELADAIRDEMGQSESDAFVGVVKPALESMYTAMESTREALTQGVGMLTGEGGAPAEDMGAEPAADAPADDAEMEPTVDQEDADAAADEFAAADAATGGDEEAGREKRESKVNKKKMIETSRRLGTILSKKK
tara:strand:- start:4931 stop:6202 length:1272 start_codon:yes stop_codon:yes gene_type:complete